MYGVNSQMKKTCLKYIGRLISHCLFSKWHKESDLFMISGLSKDDLCSQHHVVMVYELDPLDKVQAFPFQNYLSITTLWAK